MKPRSLTILRRLLPYFRGRQSEIALAVAAVVVVTACTLSRPIILRYIIDSAVPHPTWTPMALFGLLFLVLLVLSIFVGYHQMLVMARLGLTVVNRIKAKAFRHVLHLDLPFHNAHKTGWLISRIESDAEQLKSFCSQATVRLVMDLFTFLGIVVILVVSDWEIALPMVGVIIVLFLIIYTCLGKVRTLYDAVRGKYAELTGFISEYVQGVPIVQLYNRQGDIRREMDAKSGKLYDAQLKASVFHYGAWAVFSFATEVLLVGIVIWLGVAKYLAGAMSLGELIMFIQFSRQMTYPLHALTENLAHIQRSVVAADRLFGLMDEKPHLAVVAKDDSDPQEPDPAQLTFRNVSFRYNEDEWALRNVSFSIRRGEKVAIVGPSGGGKTTTANLLCRFYDPTEGSVFVDDQDLRTISEKIWRTAIGLVLQDVFLFPGTVMDNLRVLDNGIAPERVRDAAQRLGAEAFIQRFPKGYDTELAERGANLSMGERQLLSFARALTRNPRLLVLDEATSSVDRRTEALIQEALERLLEGRTAVIIAHRLATVRSADRILVFNKGVIEEEGSHDALVARDGLYNRLYSLQMQHRTAEEAVS